MKSKIFVVVPVFNRLPFTKKCLTSIFSQSYKNYEVILVDDGSSDGTSIYVKEYYPKTKVIKGNGKWWWTKSTYEGVKYALKKAKSYDYILTMNNDLFFENNYFQKLINAGKKYRSSIIGSTCVRAQDPTEVVEIGVRIDWPTGLVYGVAQTISNRLSYYRNMKVVDNIDALPGKGTLIPVEVFRNGINFDYKTFPHYIADYEFSIRAKRNGFNLLVSTDAIAKHYWEATGISGRPGEKKRTYSRALSLLFGRKSMNNIIDWLNFIKIACPDQYKIRNYYYAYSKIVKAALSVFPFYYILPLLPIFGKLYHGGKLFLYRLKLKIKQFPKVYLNKN